MMTAKPLIGFGQVRHNRTRPKPHAFSYATYFLMLPIRSLKKVNDESPEDEWTINKPGLLSFFETDHGDGRAPEQGGALGWLDELLQREGIDDAVGEVWLHTYPRVMGYSFKPVSFWYCHRASSDQGGALRAIIVEVNNTFGERHCYLLDSPNYGVEKRADKVLHVSPFNQVQGHYRFRFMRSAHQTIERTVARIDYYDGNVSHNQAEAEALLQTSVSGSLQLLTPASIRHALWRYPAMTWGVVLRIHMQALRLWFKKVPFIRKPATPKSFVSR